MVYRREHLLTRNGATGTPTYGSARAHVLASAVGSQIEFVQAVQAEYLASPAARDASFDFVVFCHCIWYFSRPEMLPRMLARARGAGIPRVLVAEYALSASHPDAVPHVLAALAVNALESFRGEGSLRNIRCAVTPAQISAAAAREGCTLAGEDYIVPEDAQRDGWREVIMVLKGSSFARHVGEIEADDKVKHMLLGMRDALAASVEADGLDRIRNMDVWVARFEWSGVGAV